MALNIDTIEVIKVLNTLHKLAELSMFGAYRDGFQAALNRVAEFIHNYEDRLNKDMAEQFEAKGAEKERFVDPASPYGDEADR